ncbi:MAG TPA: S9 family peptidase [Candidatus Acidoferrales bacterium]|nr:S9 family peptidase [Candidatus Acidoferrales bacterium]
MNLKTRAAIAVIAVTLAAVGAHAQASEKRAITFKDLISMHRVSDPQISPDDQWVAYSVATPDMEANRLVQDIWIVPVSGGDSRQLTHDGNAERPRWSPDSKRIAFLSSRDGAPQVYSLPVDGGEAVKVSSLSTGADNELWSPDGKWIAFVSSVYPDCKDDACNAARDAEKAKSKVKARIYEKLFIRHWNAWSDGKRSHLFAVPADGGVARDLTPGADYDVPPFSLGGPEAIAFSPDGQELCFTANADKEEAISTNGDLWTVPVSGATEPKRITTNPGDDWGPAYSPDGKWIAYRAQLQAGYESDRWRLMLYSRKNGKSVNRTETFDRNVESLAWSADSKTVYFQTEEKFELPIYAVAASVGVPRRILSHGSNEEFVLSRDGRTIVFTRTTLAMPAEIFAANADGTDVRQLTHQNGALLSPLDLPAPESFWFTGAEGTQVQGLLLRPPHFDPKKKYPMLLLIHGGPQVEWDDAWGYRWNPQVMTAPGYVALLINPRGSPGYGSKFEQEISRDWGGKVYEDLRIGVDTAVSKYPFIEGSRVAAAGGSYGGYMVDWIATHSGRFKCLISHAGPWDEVSMYGGTEELWFPEWEFGGTPWANPELYKKWSSSEFAGALGKFKTPTLVIAGEQDYRVPYTQSLEFFTALQRQGVPSKLMIFPDEGHWILKPQNSELWYKTFLDWLARYL